MVLKAIEEGTTLLIHNVSTRTLSEDAVLLDILKCRRALHTAKNLAKVMVGLGHNYYTFIIMY